MAMEASLEHVCMGCNRTPHCADWNANGLFAYGADKSIALATCKDGGGPDRIIATLHGHSDRVNCVHWISCRVGNEAATELVSGSVDKNVILWQQEGSQFVMKQVLSSHTAAVTCLAAIHLQPSREGEEITSLIASGSSDSTAIIWERRSKDGQFILLQTISFGRGFALGMDFFILPGTNEPVFACGGDDTRVNIFVRKDGKFSRVQSLTGHEDWVRDLKFAQEDGGDLLLASCSQDGYIRLWRISPERREEDPGELRLSGNILSILIGQEEKKFTVTLESILMGHEDWIYSICWHPVMPPSLPSQPLCLLSTSMDKTMMLWRLDPDSGVWLEQVRVGEVGGNTLGLYGGLFSPQGDLILAHGYHGAFHLWKRVSETDQSEDSLELWCPLPTLSGHFGPVCDIAWEPERGAFLVSISADQTARLISPWQQEGGKAVTWHEIARPQIHGYDMQCITMTTSLQYVSGADEKVLRVFEAPQKFVGNLLRISKVEITKTAEDLPLGASVPSLGLSNKAIFTYQDGGVMREGGGDDQPRSKNPFADHVAVFTPTDLTEPPVEEQLLQNTLWPETQKLYGHGYEIFCVSNSPDGRYVASACKASKQEHASIRVWDSQSWRQVALLTHHSLTVTQMAFSHSGLYLLAVSRDRCWSLWKRNKDKDLFVLVAQTEKTTRTHSRIIWGCSWACDDSCFVTASRDKKVYLWSQHSTVEGARDCGEGWRVASQALECAHAVTAVDFAPITLSDKRHLLAVGLESGEILLYTCQMSPPDWSLAVAMDTSICHTSPVRRLRWKPLDKTRKKEGSSPSEFTLASCGQDCAVRLFRVISHAAT